MVDLSPQVPPKDTAHWITGELFGLLNQAGINIEESHISPSSLSALIHKVKNGEINQNTAKSVLEQMLSTGKSVEEIVLERCLTQISDTKVISDLVKKILDENPEQVDTFLLGKDTVAQWFFGQVMRAANGQVNPQILVSELEKQLLVLKEIHSKTDSNL